MKKHIVEEAKRCLQCKKPSCVKGCPVSTPINQIIEKFLNGQIMEAGELLFQNNPLSVICSLVCPHEKQCEGHCILHKKGVPIHFGDIEYYISSYYLNMVKPDSPAIKGKKIAIIGSGPAGITIAIILASRGYDIALFEAHDQIGGVLRYGIPEFRLPKNILEKYKEKLMVMGIKIRPNTFIGQVLTVDDLFRDGYEAVFVGTGVWKPKPLGIKGESLGHVHYAIDYLKNPSVYELGHRVCIIGAGNVAMDVARTAIRNGVREVYIMYRSGYEDITADKHEVDYAMIDGVKFEYNKSPVEFVDEGVIYQETETVKDQEGDSIIHVQEGPATLFKADSVIIAISQGPRDTIVSSTRGIAVDEKGLIMTNQTGMTTREGVFASGDVVTGARTVAEAVRVSKIVADAMDRYVKSVR
ncbi:MAG: NAD(P)-dependent oxidoreductase [Peptococcaceae bacterium]|nr:NAD(P)-dependent oxidoreductase [Peptococcaceae bacterium]